MWQSKSCSDSSTIARPGWRDRRALHLREIAQSAVAALLVMLFVTRPDVPPWQVGFLLWLSFGVMYLLRSHETTSVGVEPTSALDNPQGPGAQTPDLVEPEPEPVQTDSHPPVITPEFAEALIASFKSVQDETENSAIGVERVRALLTDAIGQLHASFSSLQVRSRAQHEMMDELIRMLAPNGEGHGGESEDFVRVTSKLLEGFVEYILGTSKESMQVMIGIRGAQSQLREIRTFCRKSERIASQTTMLAINAKIEAASAGKHGRTFAVVADEVRALAGEAREFSQRISQLIETASETIDRMASTVAALASRDMTDTISAKGRVDAMASSVAGLNEKLEKTVEAAEQLSLDVTRDVNLAVRSLQFEDIVTQALVHSAAGMRDLSNHGEQLARLSRPGGQADLTLKLQDRVHDFRAQRSQAPAEPAQQRDMEAGEVELF